MRAVLQRVKQASVHVDGKLVSSIGPGILALIGVSQEDTPEQIDTLVRKMLTIRLWPEGALANGAASSGPETRLWRANVAEFGGEILCVSQFTLHAKLKGTRPDFHAAMGGEQARVFYDAILSKLQKEYIADKIQDGEFGAMMDVALINDGPVTIALDTLEKK
ncbi:D-tyrosyl-tRNA(Tyr) deacylase [Malassezia vespertilionis]|uniref:D-tyrosyl-tRNA(Tyr) deacylase n=1 Tax=Malassezia vespertilionis TaxID=2020962 RepID=UPI0024B0D5DC|nr:D-tyrosyl-tRNA(Tyr) deacylase [Malassezia vespertilionis]WFD07582.1 D-tyrosyl-tRNA(Tyr) deacylase [Malassezia vespertilionis]